jgi:hypothetical protein
VDGVMKTPTSRWSRKFGLVCASALLYGCVTLQTGGPREGEVAGGRFEFGLIGDQQYTAEDEAKFPDLIQDLNEADLAFVVHDGDFKRAIAPCSDQAFAIRKDAFEQSKHPFIYTPGDNEWTDCHGRRAGGHDPLERLAKLRELFFSGDRSLGQRTLRLVRQSGQVQYSKFRENVRWTYGDALFVTLHMVGKNNNLGRTPAMDAEYYERNAANLAWMRQAFDLAKRDGRRGVVIIAQANPWFRRSKSPKQATPSGFEDFLAALESQVLAYGKPVVLVHGDTHTFRIDKPLANSETGRIIEHFTRVETFGAPDVHWVRGIVDPRDPDLFTFKPQIVKKNLVDHSPR